MARKDRILIEHLGKEYVVDIIDCQPNIVVDIVECDVEVDIEYKDLYHLKDTPTIRTKFDKEKRYFQGTGHSLRASSSSPSTRVSGSGFHRVVPTGNQEKEKEIETRFTEEDKNNHFKGKGHRLC